MLNKIILIGRLVADPEMRYTQSGIAIVNFRLAVDRRFKNANGERDTDFINIVAWRKTAELINEYTKKGYMVAVEGSLQMRRYQTKEGENRTAYEVQAENIQFLDRGGRSGGSSGESVPPPSDSDAPPTFDSSDSSSSYESSEKDDSDLPF